MPAFSRWKEIRAPVLGGLGVWAVNIQIMLNTLELTGRARTHVLQRDDLRAALHADALTAFLDMKADAARAGIDLAITSAFRDFAAQQRIWDAKYRGERPVYDENGCVRDQGSLSDEERVEAIMCWSAVPGASRHHWGSELDLVDHAAMPEGYRILLAPAECAPGGVFYPLHCWLDANLARYGYFRPYGTFRGGVRPEPWHVSFAAVSVPALAALTREILVEAIEGSDMLGRELVLARIAEIYDRYVANVDTPAPHVPAH
jgi:LAS superfamily LD-carboxypeptidase LdcB